MLFRVLGPLEIEVSPTERITLSGQRLRALLVVLLLRPAAVVPLSTLVEALWGEQPPEEPANALHQVVHRLRSGLGPLGGAVRTCSPGYLLAVDRGDIDAERFEAGVRSARSAGRDDPAGAVAILDEVLALWRGPAFGEFADGVARAPAARLEELRLAAEEERVGLLLRGGDVAATIAAARDLVGRAPLRDRPVEVLVQALAADGRVADALEAYRRYRGRLVADLGLEPGPALHDLQARVLRGELGPTARSTTAGRGAGPASLPWLPGPVLGRETDLSLLLRCLTERPLVTIVGPGGVGKTRLALEAAHGLAAEATSVWWSDLSTVPPHRVVDALAEATGVDAPRGPDPAATLARALAAHRGLLCLDNAETVLDALSPLVERLVGTAAGLTVLVTSRERLAVGQEHVHLLAPLRLPTGAERGNPAVRLFIDRAPGLEPDSLSDDEVAVVGRICRRLDGLPLAIELGAAHARTFGLREFEVRLGQDLDLLIGGRRTAAARHRSVRAVIDWSFGMLPVEEARVFAQLAVFPGSFSADQAEWLCSGDGTRSPGVGPLLARLVERSLIQAGDGRFRLLETLRTYARERLAEDEPAARGRHAADTARRLTVLTPGLSGPSEPEAVAAITALTPDLHAAWAWASTHDRDLAVDLAAGVLDYAYFRQRGDLLEWGLTVAGWEIVHGRLADALAAGAAAAVNAGRLELARELAERGVAAAGGRGEPGAARSMDQFACVAMMEGRTTDALASYRRAAALFDAAGEPVPAHIREISTAQVLSYAGPGSATSAAVLMTGWLERARADGNASGLAWASFVLGEAVADTDPERAWTAYGDAIRCGTPADNRLFVTLARSAALRLAASGGPPDRALAEFGRVMEQWEQWGNEVGQWWVLVHLVILLVRVEPTQQAALLAGAALASLTRYQVLSRDTGRVAAAVDTLRARLGDPVTDRALAEGAQLSLARAVAEARRAITALGQGATRTVRPLG
jgi:predicted ATPase/DNA-binding SARP family transcriptional activator